MATVQPQSSAGPTPPLRRRSSKATPLTRLPPEQQQQPRPGLMGAVTSRRPTSSASPSGAAAKPSAPSGAVQLHVQSLPVPDGVRKSGRSGSASGQAAPQQPGGLLVQFQGSEEQISSLVMIEGPDFCNLVMDVPLGVTIILMRRERDTNLSWTCRTCPGLGLQVCEGQLEQLLIDIMVYFAEHSSARSQGYIIIVPTMHT